MIRTNTSVRTASGVTPEFAESLARNQPRTGPKDIEDAVNNKFT
jgi:hypothetical protein